MAIWPGLSVEIQLVWFKFYFYSNGEASGACCNLQVDETSTVKSRELLKCQEMLELPAIGVGLCGRKSG